MDECQRNQITSFKVVAIYFLGMTFHFGIGNSNSLVTVDVAGAFIGILKHSTLLSDPYMKSSANKDHNSWGGLERKDKAEPNIDLRSRGLCLVLISCTPQIYRENTGPDYWPTYRGCLFR